MPSHLKELCGEWFRFIKEKKMLVDQKRVAVEIKNQIVLFRDKCTYFIELHTITIHQCRCFFALKRKERVCKMKTVKKNGNRYLGH